MRVRAFTVPVRFGEAELRTVLAGRLDLRIEGGAEETLTYCDSYDWGLYRSGLTLACNGTAFRLDHLRNGSGAARAGVSAATTPRFAWEFPPGELRDLIARPLKSRALLRLVSIRRKWETGRLLNDAGRTVLNVLWDRATLLTKAGEGETVARLVLHPVGGFAQEYREIHRSLRESGLEAAPATGFEAILARAAITPGAYSSKIDLQLAPQMPAREATRIICRSLLRTMQRNEAGIKRDIDSEFLHDFRVAVRRTRSALTMFRGVFPADETRQFKSDFSFLGSLTGPLRDLDVYLLKREEYWALLPPELRPGVAELFAILDRRRQREHSRVSSGLNSERYREITARWGRFLTPESCARCGESPRAEIAAQKLAADSIAKYHQRVLKRGGRINAASPDTALHRLRIDCKNLRYLLEFFASLYVAEDVAKLVKQLKKLQDNLGDYNDLALQIGALNAHLETVAESGGSVALNATLGGLITKLHQKKSQVRTIYGDSFAAFASGKTTRRFRQLSIRP